MKHPMEEAHRRLDEPWTKEEVMNLPEAVFIETTGNGEKFPGICPWKFEIKTCPFIPSDDLKAVLDGTEYVDIDPQKSVVDGRFTANELRIIASEMDRLKEQKRPEREAQAVPPDNSNPNLDLLPEVTHSISRGSGSNTEAPERHRVTAESLALNLVRKP